MAYCTYTAIMTINPMLPQTDTAAGWSVTVATISQHITRADGIIDSYVGRRYALPLSPVPPSIRAMSQDMVSYYTYRSFFTQDNHNRTEYFEELYRQAREDLEKIRDGAMDLFDTAGSDMTVKSSDTQSLLDSTTKNYQSFFDVDDPKDWNFDSDLLDEINNNR